MGSTVEKLTGIFLCLAGHVADVGDSRRRIEWSTGSAGREARIKVNRQGTRGQDTTKIDKNGTSGAGAAGVLGEASLWDLPLTSVHGASLTMHGYGCDRSPQLKREEDRLYV